MEQRTEEWFAQRLGKATASRIVDVVAKTKSGYSTSRENYKVELALERITGSRAESYTNAAMDWGTEHEPEARAEYCQVKGVEVVEVGMVEHHSIPMSGASPDGLVGEDGLLEIKCPNSATHIKTLRSQKPEAKYITQMMWQMACTGRKWCDFVSYDPRMPEGLTFFVTRIKRDEKIIKELEAEVSAFLAEVDGLVKELTEMQSMALVGGAK
ncbi:MAG: lambda exonuclease family protein [Dehalococcoidia bacterium]|jgi:putative phage-type endonuclease